MQQDIRWRQRYQNYSKALSQLDEFVALPELNKFERQGLIQCFEYTFELAWKTMKDFLDYQGIQAPTPRAAIQQAFASALIGDGHAWIDALEKRNLMAHTYDEGNAAEAERLIRSVYHPILKAFSATLEAQWTEDV